MMKTTHIYTQVSQNKEINIKRVIQHYNVSSQLKTIMNSKKKHLFEKS